MALTNTGIQALKAADKPYSKPDGQGLILYVHPIALNGGVSGTVLTELLR